CKLPEAKKGKLKKDRLKKFRERIKKLTLELKEVENQFWEEKRK
ncbi:unnamed protein product, partial [marine sediment metagenome]